MTIYFLAKCPNCASIQSGFTKKDITQASLYCYHCHTRRVLFSKRTRQFVIRILKQSNNPQLIAKLAGKVKEEIHKDSVQGFINKTSKQLDKLEKKTDKLVTK